MTARSPEQVAADRAESARVERYLRQRQLAGLVGEAIARAEALWRLEAILRQPAGRR